MALAWVAAGVAQACGVLRVALRCANVPRCVQLQRLASALSFGAGQVGIRRQPAVAVCATVCEAASRGKFCVLRVLGMRGGVCRLACELMWRYAALFNALCVAQLHDGNKVHHPARCVHLRWLSHDKRVTVHVCVRARYAGEGRSDYIWPGSACSARRKKVLLPWEGRKLFC